VSAALTLPPDPVVLVHGVGFGPQTLAPVVRRLGPAAGARVLVLVRRGYGWRADEEPAAAVEDHVSDLRDLLDTAGIERAIVAGTSGGATVALAAALTLPERVAVAVAHEPAVGTLSAELRNLVRGALLDGGGLELQRALAGKLTWAQLRPADREAAAARAALVEADAPAFLAWEPPLERAPAAAPVLCTVGDRSPPLRHAIARRLGTLLPAPVITLRDCGHLAQLDAPDSFADAVLHASTLVHATAPRSPA